MSKINILAIDKALHQCFAELGMTGVDYVFVVQHRGACAIGSNVDTPTGPQRLMAAALRVMATCEPDLCEMVDSIGTPRGRA